jgi:hypothetical protein
VTPLLGVPVYRKYDLLATLIESALAGTNLTAARRPVCSP